MIDHFLTIESPTESLIKEKSSKFYAYAFPVSTTLEVDTKIQELKKAHLKSRHHCYAYILGAEKLLFRANDDGEPSGTAGRPILGQIEKRKLTDTLVVVVRYFGGTKLGTSGLIKAYKEAASTALDQTRIVKRLITGKLFITCSFDQIGTMMNILSTQGFNIVNVDYTEMVRIELEIRISKLVPSVTRIKAKFLNRSTEDIDKDTQIEHVNFTIELP